MLDTSEMNETRRVLRNLIIQAHTDGVEDVISFVLKHPDLRNYDVSDMTVKRHITKFKNSTVNIQSASNLSLIDTIADKRAAAEFRATDLVQSTKNDYDNAVDIRDAQVLKAFEEFTLKDGDDPNTFGQLQSNAALAAYLDHSVRVDAALNICLKAEAHYNKYVTSVSADQLNDSQMRSEFIDALRVGVTNFTEDERADMLAILTTSIDDSDDANYLDD